MGETHAWAALDIFMSDFFMKDRIDKGEVRVKYCPTHLMLADYFTKPLMGNFPRSCGMS